jgi:hypothetical protein
LDRDGSQRTRIAGENVSTKDGSIDNDSSEDREDGEEKTHGYLVQERRTKGLATNEVTERETRGREPEIFTS